jgi:hypothetical protein
VQVRLERSSEPVEIIAATISYTPQRHYAIENLTGRKARAEYE